jgi:hypothetical protein
MDRGNDSPIEHETIFLAFKRTRKLNGPLAEER